MSLPLVWQVYTGGMRKSDYLEWVHRPHRRVGTQGGCRLFANPELERLSKTPWWVVPTVWLPVSVGCMAAYAAAPEACATRGAALGALGLGFWSMLEYGLHRFVFHGDARLPDHPLALTAHFLFHGVHHKVPADPLRLVMPPAATALLAMAIAGVSRAGLWWLPTTHFAAFFAGTLAGYVGYDMTHFTLHHTRTKPDTLLARRQHTHLRHHAQTREIRGFGVTHSFWDKVFSTAFAQNQS